MQRNKTHQPIVIGIAVVFQLLLVSGDLSAQDTTCGIIWDEPVILSDTAYNTYSPELALSSDDTIHITWWGGGKRLSYLRSTDSGQKFSTINELLTDSVRFPFSANRPSIVAWRSNVYVFFQGATPGIYSPVRMVKSTNGGSTWQDPVDISPDTTGPPPLTPTICGDTIIMSYLPRGQVTHNILRSINGGSTWVSTNAGLPNHHNMAVNGVLHLLQLDDTTGDTEYRRSHNLGDSWIQRALISTLDGYGSLDPSIAASGSSLIAAWRDEKYGCIGLVGCSVIGRIGFADRETTMFHPERVLTDFPAGYEPSLSVRGNRTAATWPMDREQPPRAQVRVSEDTTWCSTFDPSTGIATRGVIAVRVAISSKAVHVVWEASQAPSPSTFRIFYRRGRFIETSVRDNQEVSPVTFNLCQNYPNPFNPSTTITYTLDRREFVRLAIYDVLGREVVIPVQEYKEPGEHTVTWQAEGLPTGVYYYRVTAGSGSQTRKAILLR